MTHSLIKLARVAVAASLVTSTLVVAAASLPTGPVVAAAPADGSGTDQIIVTFNSSNRKLGSAEIAGSVGPNAMPERSFGERSQIIKLPSRQAGNALEATMRALAKRPGVTEVAPDQLVNNFADDTKFAQQWDLTAASDGPIGIDVIDAWAVTSGSSNIRVAVIDTGYLDHADLAGRIVGGYDFISDSRIANDGGGRDADAHDVGDWISSSDAAAGSFFEGCRVSNSSWHGSHVAGTIGAATNNGAGIAGINPTSLIVPVRVLGKCGGYTSDIVDAMRWSAGLPVTGVPLNPHPAKVLSLSLGGGGSCTSAWQSAINDVTAAGAVVVVAAGNSNTNAANFSPASCAGVITVAATGQAGNRSYYSNYGSTVEIAAPGGDSYADAGQTILSTVNSGSTSPLPDGDVYRMYQGTSMATPHVSGVASLMLSANPNLTPNELTQLLLQTATAFPDGSTCAAGCGSGILNAAAAVTTSAALVDPPETTTTTTTTTTQPPATTTTTTQPPATTTTTQPPATTTTTQPPATTTTTTTTEPPSTTTTTQPPVSTSTTTTTTPPTTTTTTPPTTTTTTPPTTTTTTTTTTPPEPPHQTTKLTPINGATRTPLNVRLTWEPTPTATSYQVCIDSTINSACDGTWASTRGSHFWALRLKADTRYEWQVRAINDDGVTETNNGRWFSFTTKSPPRQASKRTPVNGARRTRLNVKLAWRGARDATSYQVCFDSTVNSTCDSTWTTVRRNRFWAQRLEPGTRYEWQVRAVNEVGVTELNNGRWFTFTTAAPPRGFGKRAPVNGASRARQNVKLSWRWARSAKKFQVCIDSTINSSCDSHWTTVRRGGLWVRRLDRATDYEWQVRAINDGGVTEANNGRWFTFTTA